MADFLTRDEAIDRMLAAGCFRGDPDDQRLARAMAGEFFDALSALGLLHERHEKVFPRQPAIDEGPGPMKVINPQIEG